MKIAAIDMMFTWPPMGGSWVDFKHTLEELGKLDNQIKLFVPCFNYSYPRGRIESPLPFQVETINVRLRELIPSRYMKNLLLKVEDYKPDLIFIGDGYFFKVPLIETFAEKYPTIVRFFGHELLCPNNIKRWRNGTICSLNYLDNPWKCLMCCLPRYTMNLLKDRLHPDIFFHEFMITGSWRWFNTHRRAIKALSKVKGVIVYNNKFKNIFDRYNKNVHVVPGGVNIEKFYPLSRRHTNPYRIFLSSRLNNPLKGFILFKKSMSLIDSRKNNWQVLYTDEKDAGDNFLPLNWVPYERLPLIYRNSSMLVFVPLWEEPFGLVTLEAMASGLPVVVSNNGILPEIVKNGETGFVLEKNSPEELSELIIKLSENEKLGNQIGNNAREFVKENYTWKKIISENYSWIC
ncbi:MAG: glycosyltransferase family 4 protein [Candidatus Coatesbacteria bacterium]|nr:glycosyltransferase family 4 protein [Candidatus Coatesbacteria bacterium]